MSVSRYLKGAMTGRGGALSAHDSRMSACVYVCSGPRVHVVFDVAVHVQDFDGKI